ncbi:MAG: MarR family winged helix-turn-helix transcriptional regulator [Chitinophagales bacterium]
MKNPNLDQIYIFHLEKAYKQFKKYKNECFKKAGIDITGDQWILLKNIHENEGINQRELAKKSFKEPASITRILDILERKTWVTRRNAANDRRTYELYTTDAGKALVVKILPIAIDIREKGMKDIAEENVTKLSQMLIQIFKNFS